MLMQLIYTVDMLMFSGRDLYWAYMYALTLSVLT